MLSNINGVHLKVYFLSANQDVYIVVVNDMLGKSCALRVIFSSHTNTRKFYAHQLHWLSILIVIHTILYIFH